MRKQLTYPIYIILFLLFGSFQTNAQVSGKVFKDFNANGTFDTGTSYNEVGQAGIEVKAYDPSGAALAVTYTGGGTKTDNTGEYSVASATPNQVRLEFVLPDDYTFASSGSTGGTTVMFPTTATQDLAVNYPADYTILSNPKTYVTHFVNGDPLLNTDVGAKSGLIGVEYTANGTSPAESEITTLGKIGSCWGVAYSSKVKKIFTSAVIRRHTGLGPSGSGGIYMIDEVTNAVVNLVDLDALGFATRGSGAYAPVVNGDVVTFTTQVGTNAERGLTGLQDPSRDQAAFEQIGKIGLGDIDISDDGRFLYVTNLFDKKLYEIDLQNANSPIMPSASNIRSWSIPNPSCSGGDFHPWATKYYKGKVYVGVVCNAQFSQSAADMNANIYELDPMGLGSFGTSIFNFSLNYTKGEVSDFSSVAVKGWYPWTNDYAQLLPSGGSQLEYPQPIFSDIEFDDDGSLILGFLDRGGMQVGWYNQSPNTLDNNLRLSFLGGDILRAYKNPITYAWEIETNGKEGMSSPKPATAGANNGEGIDGGEFYVGDNTGSFGHHEVAQGGLAIMRGKNEVLASTYDPQQFDSYGLAWYSNITGEELRGYEINFSGNNGSIPSDGTFSKASSLGDIEIASSPQPIEIGNRVFMDTDNDGEQDAGEMGLDGIKVELWKAGAKVTDVTTANGGQWFFGNLDADTNYEVKILGADIPSGKSLTTSNAASNAKDLIDNDATLSGSDAVIAYKTGSAGQNNHSLDFGFKVVTTCNLATTATTTTNPTCANNDGAIDITVTGAIGTPTYAWSNGAATEDLTAISAGDYTVTVTDAGACTTIKTYSVSVTPSNQIFKICAGQTYELEIADNTLTNIKWYKDGVEIVGQTGLKLLATQTGVYTYTSNNVGGCAVGQCCPIEIQQDTNCCKPTICTNVTIRKN
jgi:SdrD B-like domain/SprB repeat